MKNAFIIHGAFGSPEENWIPWLKQELENCGYEVFAPKFPTPEGQNYENWMSIIEPYLSDFNEETILVGHSIGATFTLAILERLDVQIAKTILVSGFLGGLNNSEFDAINDTIDSREYNWDVVRKNSRQFYVLHGDSDPYVPLDKSKALSKILGVEATIVQNGGHLNESFGFSKFPQLLEYIKE